MSEPLTPSASPEAAPRRRARMADIFVLAARTFAVSRHAMMSKSRARQLVVARQAAFLVAREHSFSYPQIGRACGGRDHSTVVYGVRQAKWRAGFDADFADMLALLRKAVNVTRRFALDSEVVKNREASIAELASAIVREQVMADAMARRVRARFDNADTLSHGEALSRDAMREGSRKLAEALAAAAQAGCPA